MVLGLSPSISIDKGCLNGSSRLGPNCKYCLCRQGEVSDLRFSTFLQEIHLSFSSPDLLGSCAVSYRVSETRGASTRPLPGTVTQWTEVEASRRAMVCIHKMVLAKPGRKMVFSSSESFGR